MGEEAEPGDGNCVRREENSDGHRVVGNAHLCLEQFVLVFLQVRNKDDDEDDAKKKVMGNSHSVDVCNKSDLSDVHHVHAFSCSI